MSKLPALKPKDVLRVLLRAGFYIEHQRGSHIRLAHTTIPHLHITVPYHTRFELPPSIVLSILKQAELTREEFLKLL
ncbi:type II toxin-antitoxin system HicA family toxin [Candidatus Uhrbacteria bacterium]|nr:type II toxin-antitoxin system HicA family toxin [Candidatus Uhrbacteria bacterium]